MSSSTVTAELNHLVGDGRVHRRVYIDPQIFELEMQQIFGRAWLYVGHASQVPQPGDFVTSTLARQPIVMVRHQDGQVYVLFNRCGHRGAIVCNEDRGNTRSFHCCYHGWVFKTNGELATVPFREEYPKAFDLKAEELGMVKLPRVESYRGFIFASFSQEGPDLPTYLGPTKRNIDQIADLAPDGEIQVTGGVHRYLYPGNWKHQIENLNDGYHFYFSHASTLTGNRQFRRREGDDHGAQVSENSKLDPFQKTYVFDYGHSYCGRLSLGKRSGAVYEEYVAALKARHGEERSQELLNINWHNTIIYPNLIIQSASQNIRVVHPIAVDRTEVRVYPILLKGAPKEMNQAVTRYMNMTHAAASLVQTDDLEAFKRMQEGLLTEGSDWVVHTRGLGQDKPCADGGLQNSGTAELTFRNQFKAWGHYMLNGGSNGSI